MVHHVTTTTKGVVQYATLKELAVTEAERVVRDIPTAQEEVVVTEEEEPRTAEGEVQTQQRELLTLGRIIAKAKFVAAKLYPSAHLVPTESLRLAMLLGKTTLVGILFQNVLEGPTQTT